MFLFSSWIILSILTGVASNAFNFLNRFILRKGDDSTVYAWYVQLLRFIVFGTTAMIFDWHLVLNLQSLIIFSLLGIGDWLSMYFYMKMHAYSHLSISSIVSRTRLIWVPVLGFLLIHETLKIPDYIGIAVIFLGVSMTIAPKKLFIDKGIFYANISAFLIAFNVIMMEMALPFGSNSIINVAMALPSVFLFPLFMKSSNKRISTSFSKNISIKTLAISFNLAGMFLFMAALRVGDPSKVNAIYQGMLILSVLGGIIFLKERENIMRKLIGATITVAGVVLLSLS